MVIRGKKISLKSVEQEDIELIRQWRNSKEVNQYFIFRGHISQAQQKKWYEAISTSGRDYYFLIIVEHKPIGLIYTKDIDWERREAETGMFIADENHRNSLISFEASYLNGRYFFRHLNLLKNKAQTLASNKRALRYNKSLGFKEVGFKEVTIEGALEKIVLFELTRHDYDKMERRRELLLKLLDN